MKHTPMKKRVGKTFFGVKIGCQAFKRCCLIALSYLFYLYLYKKKLTMIKLILFNLFLF